MKKSFILVLFLILCWIPDTLMAAETINACDLISLSEAEKAVDVKLGKGILTEFEAVFMRGITLCQYTSLDKNHYNRFVNVELSVMASSEEALEKFKENHSLFGPFEKIDGIGDEALWGGNPARARGGLNIRQGRYIIEIKLNRDNDKKNLEAAKKLAEIALNRLK